MMYTYDFPFTDSQREQLGVDQTNREFAHQLISFLKAVNGVNGFSFAQSAWLHHRLRKLDIVVTSQLAAAIPHYAPLVGLTVSVDLMNMVISGDCETAYFCLSGCVPDDGSQDYHGLTTEFIETLQYFLGKHLGFI